MDDKISKMIEYYYNRKLNSISKADGDVLRALMLASKYADNVLMVGCDVGLSTLYLKSAAPKINVDIVDYLGQIRRDFIEKAFKSAGVGNFNLLNGSFNAMLHNLSQYDIVYFGSKEDRKYFFDHLDSLVDNGRLLPGAIVVLHTPALESAEVAAKLKKFSQRVFIGELLIARLD